MTGPVAVRTIARLAAVLALASLAACAFPIVTVILTPDPLRLLQGARATISVTTGAPQCTSEDQFCVDTSGQVYEFIVQDVPAGVTATVDRSLQSPSTPGTVRITFEAAPGAAPGSHYRPRVLAVLAGRTLGGATLELHVLPLVATPPTSTPVSLAAGDTHALAALADGSVLAWGENAGGQLGLGDRAFRNIPTRVPALQGVVQVAATEAHSLALTATGLVWAWGSNDRGQVGTSGPGGRLFDQLAPVQVQGLTGVQAIAAGSSHSLAVGADGSVWAWGSNRSGQLGPVVDMGLDSAVPVQVPGLPAVQAIAAGFNRSLAVGVDGSVWIWGSVTPGADDYTLSPTPVQVAGLSNIRRVVLRNAAVLALDRDGRVWGWGNNLGGQLGDGTTIDRVQPVMAQGLDNVVDIALGNYHAVAIRADGTVWSWGTTINGTFDERVVPAILPGLTGATATAAGGNHAHVLLACGQLWAWGVNDSGVLGDGTGNDRTVPTIVPGVGNDSACGRVLLRVNLAGETGPVDGAVTAAPGNLDFTGADFASFYDNGTSVVLTALASFTTVLGQETFTFERWLGDCQGAGLQAPIVLDRSRHCTAVYRNASAIPLLLSVTRNGNGLVTSSGGGIFGPAAIACGQTCNAAFRQNTVVTLTAADANGFAFTGWALDCAGTARAIDVLLDRPKTCRADYRPFELDASVIGGGTVTSVPAGLDCGDDCSYAPGAGTATLTAVPDLGWELESWDGDCSGTANSVAVTMDADKSCTATFRRRAGFFLLTMVVEGQGSVTSSPGMIACPGTCVGLFAAGTGVDLTATPASGNQVLFWAGDCPASDTTNRIVMDADRQCRVRFTGQPEFAVAEFTHTPALRVGQIGTFDGSASYVFDPATLTRDLGAITSFAWDFDQDGGIEASGGRTAASIAQHAFQTSGDHVVRLRVEGGRFFDVDDEEQTVTVLPADGPLFPLTVNKAGSGRGVVGTDPQGLFACREPCAGVGPLQLEADAVVTLTARAGVGSTFTGWSGAGCTTGAASVEVTMGAARVCTATFVQNQFTLTVNNGGNGVVTSAPAGVDCGADCNETYAGGVNVTLTAAPDPGFQVDVWTGCDVVAGTICNVSMGADRVVGVTFTPVPSTFTLSVVVNAPPGSIGGIVGVQPAGNVIDCRASGGPVCSQAFAPGTVVSVRPSDTSLELLLFGAWTSGCDSVGPGFTCNVTLTGNRTVTAIFEQ